MGINTLQIKEYIVKPVLEALELKGTNIMLGIAAQESNMGTYIHQINGPALGLWQIEPTTHDDVWRYLLRKDNINNTYSKRHIWAQTLNCCNFEYFNDRLIYDLRYCCAIARIKLYMIPKPLPAEDDIEGMAHYWKKFYNSSKGKGDADDFMANYDKYVRSYV